MKASELRTKDAAELQKELESLLKAQFNLRMQRATQQLFQHQPIGQSTSRHRSRPYRHG